MLLKPWKPRSSNGGLYHICNRVADLDRERYKGSLEVTDVDESSSAYADLGTLLHEMLQKRLSCVLCGKETEQAERDKMRASAVTLYKNEEDMDASMESAVAFAAKEFPVALDGKPWLAEPEGEIPNLTGHLDFVSQDGKEIIDLKTTTRKPDNARIKPMHISQLIGYWDLLGRQAVSARVLYLDSMKGAWAILTGPIDLTSSIVADYADDLSAKRTERMQATGISAPTFGDHCKSGFCAYRNSRACYPSLVPATETSQLFTNSEQAKPGEFATAKRKPKLW